MRTIHATRRERAAHNATLPVTPPRPDKIVRVRGRMTRKQRQHMIASQFGFRARSRRAESFEPSWDAYPMGDGR
ncbi:MAG: hypothetical protein QG550_863 [Pseudomonadota bacterium]|nr:hypothetical protein [Pseudomonadota bacterium]MDQ1343260.1 hypothetical protein [Pseudomonadota bacterium]